MTIFDHIRQQNVQATAAFIQAHPEQVNTTDERGFTPLILATYLGNQEVVKLLLDKGADPNLKGTGGNTALMGVCFKGYTEMAQLLIKHGAEINTTNDDQAIALTFAVNFDQLEMAKLLLEHGADPHQSDSQGLSPLRLTQQKGNPKMLELFDSYVSR